MSIKQIQLFIITFFSFSILSIQSAESIEYSANYTGDFVTTLNGDNQKTDQYLGFYSLNATINLEKIFSLKETQFYISTLGTHGDNPSESIGDEGGVSNIATDANSFKLYEAWFEKKVNKFSFLFGLHDLNGEFYVNEPALLFLNGSLGIGTELASTGVNGPSLFPSVSYATRLSYDFENSNYFKLGLYNAVSGDVNQSYGTHTHFDIDEGLLSILEVGKQSENSKISFGVWSYTQEVIAHDGESKKSNFGAYFLYDQKFGMSHPFFRLGYAEAEVNSIDYNLIFGSVFSMNWIEEDKLGLTVSILHGSSKIDIDSELTWELTYKFRVWDYVELQPDFQYIVNPGMDSSNESVFVFLQRVSIEF